MAPSKHVLLISKCSASAFRLPTCDVHRRTWTMKRLLSYCDRINKRHRITHRWISISAVGIWFCFTFGLTNSEICKLTRPWALRAPQHAWSEIESAPRRQMTTLLLLTGCFTVTPGLHFADVFHLGFYKHLANTSPSKNKRELTIDWQGNGISIMGCAWYRLS